jgi:S-formylglutathione hydrolase FrmB
VKHIWWYATAIALFLPISRGSASGLWRPFQLDRVNRSLHGKMVDYTHRHDGDRRIWSPALQEKRDLYVYLPPGYKPCQAYPLLIWLHGLGQDEHAFLEYVVGLMDKAMACGQLPPAIVAAPDGSLNGNACLTVKGSFFLNSKAGRFEDFVMQDIWEFMHKNYPIRPEPEAHVLAGVSMGGGAAFNLGIKYRDRVKVVVGIMPPLNTRWMDCHGRYRSNFDPCCWGWRTDVYHGAQVMGRLYGVVTIKLRQLLRPLYGRGDSTTLEEIIRENPIEMIDRLQLREGELAMYVAYGGQDQFNIDAQAESFLYLARQRGLTVEVGYDPKGRHDFPTAKGLFPGVVKWLAGHLAPLAP